MDVAILETSLRKAQIFALDLKNKKSAGLKYCKNQKVLPEFENVAKIESKEVIEGHFTSSRVIELLPKAEFYRNVVHHGIETEHNNRRHMCNTIQYAGE